MGKFFYLPLFFLFHFFFLSEKKIQEKSMAIEPDKRGQEIEYSSFGVFQANDTPNSTATHSLSSTASIQSPPSAATPPLPPSSTGYTLFRNAPRPISSIEQFDFKSSPENINSNSKHNSNDELQATATTNNGKPTTTTTLPSSSGFTTMSSYTADTSTALLKQPSFDLNDEAISNNINTFALHSLSTTHNMDDIAGSNTGHSGIEAPSTDQLDQQQQQQQQQEQEQPQQSSQQQQHLNELHENLMTYKEDQDIPPTLQQQQGTKRQRNYQTFPGNSTFFCGGRLMTSQAYWAFIIALLLMIIPSVLFGVFT